MATIMLIDQFTIVHIAKEKSMFKNCMKTYKELQSLNCQEGKAEKQLQGERHKESDIFDFAPMHNAAAIHVGKKKSHNLLVWKILRI